ncbi:MAG: hypothetical protein ACOCRO_08705 [Halanaerobiales bacterium]
MQKLIKALKYLYNYGEVEKSNISSKYISWLKEQNWLVDYSDYLIISNKWIQLSGLTQNEEDFINHLFVFHPEYQGYLLLNLLETGIEIAKAEDQDELIRYVNSLPKLSSQLLKLYQNIETRFNKELMEVSEQEWQELKSEYNNQLIEELDKLIFGGIIKYSKLLNMLKLIQKIEDNKDTIELIPLTKKVDDNWIKGRRITSNPHLKPKEDSQYTLVPVKDKYSFKQLDRVNKYLNNPWGVFLILMGMAEKQLRAENNDLLNLRPTPETENPYIPQGISYFTYLEDGREVIVDRLENVIKDYLNYHGIKMFPQNKFYLTEYFTDLLDDKIYIYKNEEYILADDIDSLLYKKPLMIVLKKYAKKFTSDFKEYAERLSESYED